jgi:ribosome biogenesis GTPase
MQLEEYGWDHYFRAHFEPYKSKNLKPARVFCERRKTYLLFAEQGEINASARGVLWHDKAQDQIRPVVGDWVAIKIIKENQASIIAVLPRKSAFSRQAPGARKRISHAGAVEQIIAANIDLGIIVTALDNDFNLSRIERYLTLVLASGAKAMIVLNKADLCKNSANKKKKVKNLVADVPVLTMVALKYSHVKKLNPYITKGKTAALLGSSGVGKSTIINQLLGYDRQKVDQISDSVGKGKHTTSRRELIILPNKGLIMDNPGMREIQLWAEESDIYEIFSDIEHLAGQCRFRDCRHQKEPGCAIQDALNQGELDRKRFENYSKMKSEIAELEHWKKRR